MQQCPEILKQLSTNQDVLSKGYILMKIQKQTSTTKLPPSATLKPVKDAE